MLRKINIKEAKYCSILENEQQLAFCIEDPIDITYNPGYTVLKNSKEYQMIIYEFQRAYRLISEDDYDSILSNTFE